MNNEHNERNIPPSTEQTTDCIIRLKKEGDLNSYLQIPFCKQI